MGEAEGFRVQGHLAGTLKSPSTERVCAPLAPLSMTIRPKITPDRPTAQVARYLCAFASLHAARSVEVQNR